MSIKVIEPIVPAIGKSYYCQVYGFTNNPPGYNVQLIPLKVEAIGTLTITVSSRDWSFGGKAIVTRTYLQGDITFIEEAPAE